MNLKAEKFDIFIFTSIHMGNKTKIPPEIVVTSIFRMAPNQFKFSSIVPISCFPFSLDTGQNLAVSLRTIKPDFDSHISPVAGEILLIGHAQIG